MQAPEQGEPDPRFDESNEYSLPDYPSNHIPGDYFCGCKNCQIDRYMIWRVENESPTDLPELTD